MFRNTLSLSSLINLQQKYTNDTLGNIANLKRIAALNKVQLYIILPLMSAIKYKAIKISTGIIWN